MFNMKFSVATVILAICLVAQAENTRKSLRGSLFKHNNEGSRIINGELAKTGQFPYQVGMERREPNGATSYCGGTILNNRWVLTAGHCVYGTNTMLLKFGATHLFEADPGQVLMTSYRIIQHPLYNPDVLHYDIALIQLPEALTFTANIQPLRLPTLSEGQLIHENTKLTVSGWGYTTDISPNIANDLRWTELDSISNKECAKIFSSNWVTDLVICAKGHPIHGSCSGDSGGPVTTIAADGQRTLTALVSFGMKSQCLVGYPSGFLRTGNFLAWINLHTGIPIRV